MKIKKILNQKLFICWCCIIIIMTAPFPAYGIKDLNIDSDFTINKAWFGDYDQMVKKYIIRILVPQSKTF